MAKGFFPSRYANVLLAFYMALVMALLMSVVLVAINTGITDGYIWRVLYNYAIAMPIAFICVLLVRPMIVRWVQWSIRQDK